MYFLDSTTMIQLALERQRDLTKGVQVSSPRERYYEVSKGSRRSLQHSAGAALVRIGRHLQA